MPRSARFLPGGYVYHVHNRAAAGVLFPTRWDYREFFRLVNAARRRHPVRVLGFCVLPAEWQFVLWPERDGEVTAFLRWLTNTHVRDWRADHPGERTGRLYRGRFRSFPVQADGHLSAVLRHVERGPVRAGLVARPEDWSRSSLADRLSRVWPSDRLSAGPIPLPADWVAYVNQEPPAAETEAVRRSEARGCPFGSADWQRETAARLGLESTLRPRGRPRKAAG